MFGELLGSSNYIGLSAAAYIRYVALKFAALSNECQVVHDHFRDKLRNRVLCIHPSFSRHEAHAPARSPNLIV
jgi:hypothetical protein